VVQRTLLVTRKQLPTGTRLTLGGAENFACTSKDQIFDIHFGCVKKCGKAKFQLTWSLAVSKDSNAGTFLVVPEVQGLDFGFAVGLAVWTDGSVVAFAAQHTCSFSK
jgi:hypothetical protein